LESSGWKTFINIKGISWCGQKYRGAGDSTDDRRETSRWYCCPKFLNIFFTLVKKVTE